MATSLRHGSPTSTRRTVVHASQILIVAVVISAWQAASGSPMVAAAVGSPGEVAAVLATWAFGPRPAWSDLVSTLQAAVSGLVIGIVGAAAMALLLVAVPMLGRFLAPYIAVFNAIPKVVLAPLFVLWFGLGVESKSVFVGSVVFMIVFYNLYVGVNDIDRLHLTNAKVLGANRIWELREVYLPSMLGWISVSLRVSVGFALLCAVVAELLGSNQGIGKLIADGQAALAPAQVIAGVLVVAVVAVLADTALRVAERRLARWRPGTGGR